VSTAATVISNVGTYALSAQVYDALALASRLAASVKNRGGALRTAYHLRRLNGRVSEFVDIVNRAMNGTTKPDPNAEPVTSVMMRTHADNFEQLYRMLDHIVAGSRRAGLTNNSLTAGSIRGIERHLDAIANLADWFDLAAQPEAITKIFEGAEREMERGELIDLAKVE
jgi:hypothetical protein